MGNHFHSLAMRDLRNPVWIFYDPPVAPHGKLLGSEYGGLVCKRCQKLNYLAALERGIHLRHSGPQMLPDAGKSGDKVTVVSLRSREVLERVAPGQVQFFPLAGTPTHFAAFPIRLIHPPADAPIYNPVEDGRPGDAFQIRGPKCRTCGRYKSVTIAIEWLVIPDDVVVAGAVIDNAAVPSIQWIGSEDVANAITEARLSGWWIQRNAFANAAQR